MVLICTHDSETHDVANPTVGMRTTRICQRHSQKTITNNPSPTIFAGAPRRILPAAKKASLGIEVDAKWSILPDPTDVVTKLCISRRTGTVPEKYNTNKQHDSDYNNNGLFHRRVMMPNEKS